MAHVFTPEARDRIARMPGEFSIEEGVTYLNAAAVGPLPDRTRQALTEFYAENASAPWKVDGMIESARETCRTLGAQLMNADPGDVTYGYSTSFGLSIAAGGLPLNSGDEVILSDSDFPANPYVWRALEQRGIKIKFARSVQGMFSIENAERLITGRTKVIAVSFVQFFNGYKLPLVELAQLAHSFDGYLVVDAIQGLGVEPLDFSGLEIDVLSAGAQKWLLGPLGIGIVAISSRARERMRPVARSWKSTRWDNYVDLFHYGKPLAADATRFCSGSAPAAHLAALGRSLELLTELGVENIQAHTHSLLDLLINFLERKPEYRILSSLEDGRRSAILSFTSDQFESLFERLDASRVVCVKREGGIRISPHVYNTKDDIERLMDLL